jgi:hypothetical protein
MHAAEKFEDTVIADRLRALTRDEPDLTAIARRIQERPSTASSRTAWENSHLSDRPAPQDQRVISLRQRLGRSAV